MNPSYRRDKDHNYMILEAPRKIYGNEYQIRMLLVNEIPGILICKMRIVDGIPAFYYEITSKQPMGRLYEKLHMEKEDIRRLLLGIRRSLEEAERFLLDVDQIILDKDFIYMDVETREVSLCYLPFYEGDLSKAFRELSEYVLKRLNHSDEEAVLWAYDIYSRTTQENYNLREVLETAYQKKKEKAKEAVLPEHVEEKELREIKVAVANGNEEPQKGLPIHFNEKEKPAKRKKIISALAGSIGIGTIVFLAAYLGGLNLTQIGGIVFLILGLLVYFFNIWERPKKKKKAKERFQSFSQQDDVMTRLPNEDQQAEEYGQTAVLHTGLSGDYPTLISMEPGVRENVVLDREAFLFGKVRGQVDIEIPLPAISRIHAKIEAKGGVYYITDLNSKNGTFLNGERLIPNESRTLHLMDEVYFAAAGYYFKE